jgi:hypothetical protein
MGSTHLVVIDLFCGAGGAARGIELACQDVGVAVTIIGVDNRPQPRYPYNFIQGEWDSVELDGADFVWASPPCQHYTQMLNHGRTDRAKHPDLISAVRTLTPHVIENVAHAPLESPGMLCGEMFGIRVTRHRFFECSFPISWPHHPRHRGKGHRKQGDGGFYYRVYGHETGKSEWGAAMGIDWMRSPELAQSVPPAYSRYIFSQWLRTRPSPQTTR